MDGLSPSPSAIAMVTVNYLLTDLLNSNEGPSNDALLLLQRDPDQCVYG